MSALEDEFFNHYISWSDTCTDLVDAYHRWTRAATADRGLAHSAYLAALDREAAAAETYARTALSLDALHPDHAPEDGPGPTAQPPSGRLRL